MAAYALPDSFMKPDELAKRLGMGILQVRSILHQDAERDVKVFPFAFSIRNEETGTWQYRIHRQRFEAWERGELADPGQLAGLIARQVAEQLKTAY